MWNINLTAMIEQIRPLQPLEDAGIKDINVHPHAFRHTIVGALIDAGNSMDVVSKYMGHANVSTAADNY